MRLVQVLIILIILFVGSTSYAYSHPGRTDSYGCHNDLTYGVNHCHNDAVTNIKSNTSDKDSDKTDNLSVFEWLLLIICGGYLFWIPLGMWISEKLKKKNEN